LIICTHGQQHRAFQPYNANGNIVHVTTADFDAVGAKDHVVTATVDGVVTGFKRPEIIMDPAADNSLWEYRAGTFVFMIGTATSKRGKSTPDNLLLPGADGHLRVLDQAGTLHLDLAASSGALYCADAGFDSQGQPRIVAGGVDGNVYVYNWTGHSVGKVRPLDSGSIIRRLVVGNFDGKGGDEVAIFYNSGGFEGGGFLSFIELDKLQAPAYWTSTEPIKDDVATLGWTEKQLPTAYDMDDDGRDELVAHWGVLHPEKGPGSLVLSTMLATGERLRLKQEYDDVYEFTNTNWYVMPKGVVGKFKVGGMPRMMTIYGDDLYLLDYNMSKSEDQRFRVSDYGYSHTLYHFTDGARLESRSGGLDRLVLSGPNSGDDRFYVVDLSGDQWKVDAKTIDDSGALIPIRSSLDTLVDGIADFKGVVAEGGPVRYIIPIENTADGWKLGPDEIEAHADRAQASMKEMYSRIFPKGMPKRVTLYAYITLEPSKNISTYEAVRWIALLAQRGVHVSVICGHGPDVFLTSDALAQLYHASVVGGRSYMMLCTRELYNPGDPTKYIPLMRTLKQEASSLGLAPQKIMLSAKGAMISSMDHEDYEGLVQYKDVIVMGAEHSNVRLNEWTFAEQASLWLTGAIDSWSSNPIGDHIATNRIAEWTSMRNGHFVLRNLLTAFSLGATAFRTDVTLPQMNPLYLRNDTADSRLALASPYSQGIVPFLQLVEAGVFPSAPERDQLQGISPVAVALPKPSSRLQDQFLFHDFDKYKPQQQQFVVNNLECWHAYTKVPDYDATTILYGSTRRWDSLIPTSPSGFVPAVPFVTRAQVEEFPWCKRAFETDGDTWADFGSNLTLARDTIKAELVSQRTNMLLVVEPENDASSNVFWQLTRAKSDPGLYFLMLMDPHTMTPSEHHVKLRLGGGDGSELTYRVFDQFGSQTAPLGTLTSALSVLVDIPAGSVRFLTLRKASASSLPDDTYV
jgi:hypothetical protein